MNAPSSVLTSFSSSTSFCDVYVRRHEQGAESRRMGGRGVQDEQGAVSDNCAHITAALPSTSFLLTRPIHPSDCYIP